MSLDLPELRPPVISKEIEIALDEFLRFRQVIRNVYTFSLKPEQIWRLVRQSRSLFDQLRDELLMFSNFLEKVGE
jgi:hypothetical protein